MTIFTPGCSASVVRNTDAAFELLVDAVFFRDLHHREQAAVVRVRERDVLARRECGRAVAASTDSVIGIGQNTPARRAVVVADSFPVGVRHEAVERREAADAEHDQVALLARADAHRAQPPGPRLLGRERLSGEHQRLEGTTSVRGNQSRQGIGEFEAKWVHCREDAARRAKP